MTHVNSPHLALAESFCSRVEIPVLAGAVLKLAYMLAAWSDRTKSRRMLSKLTPAQLADIGLTRSDVEAEISKPFWGP